jgi:hypothetical protein
MQTGYVRALFEKSSAAVLIFSLGVALGVVSFMQVPRAHAALGNDIVCFVYSTLNGVGSPIPFLNADGCPSTPPADTGTIKVVKVVSGSSASPSSFTIHLKNPSSDVGGSPQPGSSAGTSYIGLPAGSYVVSEDPVSGYTTTFNASCPAGVISLAAGSTVTCTVTNTAVITPPAAQCADGLDNDSDGLIDMADPGCSSASDNDETNGGGGSTTQCSDGVDNDTDGLIDLADPGCTNAADNDETNSGGGSTTQCSDGVDNDGDNLVDMSDPGCTNAADNDETNTTGGGGSGSTPACRDGIDNDGDNLVDSADPGCHNDGNASNSSSYDSNDTDEVNTTNNGGGGGGGGGSLPQCQDGQDNDNDGKVDSADPGCHNDGNANNAASYENNWNDESKTFSTGNGPISTIVPQNGTVLGTSTASCTALLTTYMRQGQRNDSSEVKKLQTFLNALLGTNLPVTGFFGSLTDKAVRRFQLEYHDDVLAPWVIHGLTNDQTSTGYVYKTTQRMINNLYCTTLHIPMPQLP